MKMSLMIAMVAVLALAQTADAQLFRRASNNCADGSCSTVQVVQAKVAVKPAPVVTQPAPVAQRVTLRERVVHHERVHLFQRPLLKRCG